MSLNALTMAFYGRVSASFSATRRAPWRGWEQLWKEFGAALRDRAPLRVADVGCGNMRFARFLLERTEVPLDYRGLDACAPLLAEGLDACRASGLGASQVRAIRCDVVDSLLSGEDFLANVPPSDLAVAFGFMHHLPTWELRRDLLRHMVKNTVEDGLIVASFWRFGDDERLRAKAEDVTVRVRATGAVDGLSENDYLLGWQDDADALRYCHHFTEGEIDALSAALRGAAEEVARFSADGRSGELNRYAVWRRHGRAG